ncbi:MAG TPA: phytanoyl-CoA dioxygenase family protein [Pyrinomonadaceae bacterium]|nr:phytanoyl-CoA dioxygenase family protein [Pyrinomonadaceae bacterium]
MIPALTDKQLVDYEELGYLHSIPVLSPGEVVYFREAIEETCRALGGKVTRLDGPHLFFRWAWDLSTHPRVLDCMEQLIGPDVLLKSTRLFYKFAKSDSFVGWHQDGITEELRDAHVPAIWLGLTPATAENGCLRVVPRSHRLGLIPHADRPNPDNLTTEGATAQVKIDSPQDVEMQAGEMSLHHPLMLHASNPNRSGESRIGFSATYSSPALTASRSSVAWVRGDGPRDRFKIVNKPPLCSIEAAAAAYANANQQILFAK